MPDRCCTAWTCWARLSKGKAQKVGLAQALCSGAALVVLDESWSGLDADATRAVSARIARAADDGAAVLLTDHTGRAAGLARRSVHDLVDGRLVPAAPRTPGPVAVVTLIADDPWAVATRLAGMPATVSGDRITVHVPVAQRDEVLRAALSWGCGVHAVQPEPSR